MTEQKKITLLEAVNLALHRAMVEDDNVVMLGEDIGVNGGVFRATQGLRERFGFKRVLDTPLAEAMIAGVSVGMAAQGLKPVLRIAAGHGRHSGFIAMRSGNHPVQRNGAARQRERRGVGPAIGAVGAHEALNQQPWRHLPIVAAIAEGFGRNGLAGHTGKCSQKHARE